MGKHVDKSASKSELIQELLDMQRNFIAREHAGEFEPSTYFVPGNESGLGGYRQQFTDLANQLVEMAHQEKGSKR